MRKPVFVIVGAVLALMGLVFFLQGIGVLTGSSMSNTTFWSVAGPVIMLAGLALIAGGRSRRAR